MKQKSYLWMFLSLLVATLFFACKKGDTGPAGPAGPAGANGEEIVNEITKTVPVKSILLRYFNPVGAHPSGHIGEIPIGRPANLIPAITQTAIGKLPKMQVYGDDYPTRDGSCIRDYIHVSDISHAHTLALQYLMSHANVLSCEIFNLGTGNGITVLEAIKAFEKVSGIKLSYVVGARRPGDIVAIYANNELARRALHWNPQYSLEDMMATAWNWELKLKEDETIYSNPNFQKN